MFYEYFILRDIKHYILGLILCLNVNFPGTLLDLKDFRDANVKL